jgi:hypothetical protein
MDGFVAELRSPNIATRASAYMRLRSSPDLHKTLDEMFARDKNPTHRARALWLIAPITDLYIFDALRDANSDMRIAGLRVARQYLDDVTRAADLVWTDPSPAVRRELALAMSGEPAEKAVPILVKLANQFDGEDRWYLEALGIGATGKEQAVLDAWEKSGTNRDGKAGELIRWRLKKQHPEPVRLDDKTVVIEHWWAAGPFDGPIRGALDQRLPPDESPDAIDVSKVFPGVGGKPVPWERVDAVPYEGTIVGLKWVDFKDFCEDRGYEAVKVVGYFAATLVSPVDQPGKLLVGSNDCCRLWFNGEEVLTQSTSRDVRFADETVPVQFRRGGNVVFINFNRSRAPAE